MSVTSSTTFPGFSYKPYESQGYNVSYGTGTSKTTKIDDAAKNLNNIATIKGAYLDDKVFREWIFKHADEVEDIIEDGKAKQEREKLNARRKINRYYRNLVKHVKFSGDACIVYWGEDDYTVVRWDHDEEWDAEKAILACMAKRLFGNTNIYCEVLQKYAPAGEDHYWDVLAWEERENEEWEKDFDGRFDRGDWL